MHFTFQPIWGPQSTPQLSYRQESPVNRRLPELSRCVCIRKVGSPITNGLFPHLFAVSGGEHSNAGDGTNGGAEADRFREKVGRFLQKDR